MTDVPSPPEHPEGRPYNIASYNRGCRCEGCRTVKANARRIKRGEPILTIPELEAIHKAPKRPPGWCWVDDSGITQVVRCERCDKNYGTWVLDKTAAQSFREAHAQTHAGEPAFDWSAWDTERLIKAGGRPPLDERPLCEDELCTEPNYSKGLCQKHYMRQLRAEKAKVHAVIEARPQPKPCPERISNKALCKEAHCDTPVYARGRCGKHDRAARRAS